MSQRNFSESELEAVPVNAVMCNTRAGETEGQNVHLQELLERVVHVQSRDDRLGAADQPEERLVEQMA